MTIYPNPNNGTFYVDVESPINGTIEIMTLQNQIIFELEITCAETLYKIALKQYSKGPYIVKIKNSDLEEQQQITIN